MSFYKHKQAITVQEPEFPHHRKRVTFLEKKNNKPIPNQIRKSKASFQFFQTRNSSKICDHLPGWLGVTWQTGSAWSLEAQTLIYLLGKELVKTIKQPGQTAWKSWATCQPDILEIWTANKEPVHPSRQPESLDGINNVPIQNWSNQIITF